MNTVPVSVIIPCYNCENTIHRAVSSVVRQTARPAEVMLINDASTDNTLHLLYKLQKKYSELGIHVLSLLQNQGPGVARNIGWNHASAACLAFLDADDVWHPEKLNCQYGWMTRHPDIAITSHRCIQIVRDAYDFWKIPSIPTAYELKPWNLLLRNQMLTRSVMLYRMLPFRFPEEKRHSEDYCLWLEMVLNGIHAWYIDTPLAASFKFSYGEGGLSRNLSAMESGELDTYRRLRRKKLLSTTLTIGLFGFSLIKHFRRMLISLAKKTHVF